MYVPYINKIDDLYVTVVACPHQGIGNDPEALGLAFHQGPAFINED